MISTSGPRPNHYQILELEPTASAAEVERAFARQISILRPRAFGGVAEVGVAYETLRDPARRRAYDASIGLKPVREPSYSLSTQGVGGASFVRHLAPAEAFESSAPPAEADSTPFIAAALRELARPEPLIERAAPPAARPPVETESGGGRVHLTLDDAPEAEDGSSPWKRVGIVAGAVIVAGGLLGAWAGWDAGSSAEAQQDKSASIALPPPTTFTVGDPTASVVDGAIKQAAPQPLKPVRSAHMAPKTRPVAPERVAVLTPAAPGGEQAAAEPTAEATPAAASLSLPNGVIARTIERIGYACGEVASTSSTGTPGVFKVTCTSGHAYQAAPVHGRYRFRRLAR